MTHAAVVNYGPEKFNVEMRDIARPEIGSEDVLLQVAAVGVCGSDLHQWTAEHSWPVNYPVVLGHEFAGTVVELGDRVKGWREGDRGVSETAAVIDLDSPLTKQGLYNLDPTRKGFGYGVNGAMTKFVRPFMRVRIAFWIYTSVLVSTLLVASSRISIGGSVRRARAIVRSCLSPCDRFEASSLRSVS